MSGRQRTDGIRTRPIGGVEVIRYARDLDEALRILAQECKPRKPRKRRIVKMPKFTFGGEDA